MNKEPKIDVDLEKGIIIVNCDDCKFINKFKIVLHKNINTFKCKGCGKLFEFDKGFSEVFKQFNILKNIKL